MTEEAEKSKDFNAREATDEEQQLSDYIYKMGIEYWKYYTPPDFAIIVAAGLGKLMACHEDVPELDIAMVELHSKVIAATIIENYKQTRPQVLEGRAKHREDAKKLIAELMDDIARRGQNNDTPDTRN